MLAASVLDDAARQYAAGGWCLVPGLLPASDVTVCRDAFLQIALPDVTPMLRQSGAVEPHRKTPQGYMINGLLNPHVPSGDGTRVEFTEAVLGLAAHTAMQNALRALAAGKACALMQTMLFDFSPATAAHQDCVYLDSVPAGHLIGAWIALEDIAAEAGRFFVLPLDETPPLPEFTRADVYESKTYMPRLRAYFRQHQDKMIAPAMKAGDVLFWNSHVIHGAARASDLTKSRKSLTAHYLPEGFAYGNVFGDRHEFKLRPVNGMAVYG